MGMGASPDPTSGKGSSPTQPTSGKGSGQPAMGQPNQYMQGQTGNGDPNNSTGTVQTPQPTVSAPSNDYRSTIGMPQWDSSQTGSSGKTGGGGKMGGAFPTGGKGGSALPNSFASPIPSIPDQNPLAAPAQVQAPAPVQSYAQPDPTTAPAPTPTFGKGGNGSEPHGH